MIPLDIDEINKLSPYKENKKPEAVYLHLGLKLMSFQAHLLA